MTPSASTPSLVVSRSTRRGSVAREISHRVERMVTYVRSNFYAGEQFRISMTAATGPNTGAPDPLGCSPCAARLYEQDEVFATDELPQLDPVPDTAFDVPVWTHPKVAPDRHVQVAKALYSMPGELVGKRIDARADAHSVKLFWRGELIKVHPLMAPGRRHTDPADLPAEVSIYAMRDITSLQRKAAAHGTHIGVYAAAVLEHPLPWTKMRQVYRLLGLVRRHGGAAVKDTCGVP